jgi:hypothetical protein
MATLWSEIDHDFALRPRLAGKDETLIGVGWGQAVGIVLLDGALEEDDLACPALTGPTGKGDRNVGGNGQVKKIV